MDSDAVDGVEFFCFFAATAVLLAFFLFFPIPLVLFLWLPEDVVLGIAGKSILAGKGSSTGIRLLSVVAGTGCAFFLCLGGPLSASIAAMSEGSPSLQVYQRWP